MFGNSLVEILYNDSAAERAYNAIYGVHNDSRPKGRSSNNSVSANDLKKDSKN